MQGDAQAPRAESAYDIRFRENMKDGMHTRAWSGRIEMNPCPTSNLEHNFKDE